MLFRTLCATLSVLLVASQANAGLMTDGFEYEYDPANWTFLINGGDGAISTFTKDTLAFDGSDNGTGGNTDVELSMMIPADGDLSFDFNYSSTDTPPWDSFGYVLDGVYTQLADNNGLAGSALVPVLTGQTFSFRVNSVDGGFGPGVVSITNFSAPSNVPEPASIAVWGTIGIGLAIFSRRRRKVVAKTVNA